MFARLRLCIAFFTWMTTLGRILMVENLIRRVFWFYSCKLVLPMQKIKNEETVNHLLTHCDYISDLWHLVFKLFRVSWAMPSNILELLHCWKTRVRGHSKEAIWKVILAFLMWSIWREMNRRLFENCVSYKLYLNSFFLRSLLDWVVVYVPNFSSC